MQYDMDALSMGKEMIRKKDVFENKSTRERYVVVEEGVEFAQVQKLYSNSSHQGKYYMISVKSLLKEYVRV